MGILDKHAIIEKNATLLLVGSLLVVSIGGIVEIAPLFYLQNTIEKVEGMRPYSPLELAGRQIYIREGCYVCHSQMIRPFRDEVERYGHYSLAAESMYDHPFQWGSKRTGPDLAARRRPLFERMACPAPERAALGRAGIGDAELFVPQHDRTRHQELLGNGNAHCKQCRGRALYERHAGKCRSRSQGAGRSQCGYDRGPWARYPKAKVGDFDGDPAR